jgi:hypothetical protein
MLIKLGALDASRNAAIEKIVATCHGWLHEFCSWKGCPLIKVYPDKAFACKCLLLGGLTQCLEQHGLLSPRPKKQFQGWSIESISKAVKNTLLNLDSNSDFKVHDTRCRYKKTVIHEIEGYSWEGKGLNLERFTDRGDIIQ